RLSAQRAFIVDPVDGTRAFIAHDTDWTILIALIEDGRPIASAVVAPARGEIFRAVKGGGAFRNDQPVRVSTNKTLEGAKLAAPKQLLQSGVAGAPIAAQSVYFASLGYRLACVADGRLDGAAIRPNAQDWDLAAVDLLVHEAGGALSNLDDSPVRYDRAATGHGAMVAGSPAICSSLQQLVKNYLERGI
ncbi:MAG: inositol monophosphatase family protein, partial [Alphaproteobacteria bacterium]